MRTKLTWPTQCMLLSISTVLLKIPGPAAAPGDKVTAWEMESGRLPLYHRRSPPHPNPESAEMVNAEGRGGVTELKYNNWRVRSNAEEYPGNMAFAATVEAHGVTLRTIDLG